MPVSVHGIVSRMDSKGLDSGINRADSIDCPSLKSANLNAQAETAVLIFGKLVSTKIRIS